VIEVHPSVEVGTLPGLITYARANPGKLKVAFAGNGTPQHLGIELFKMMAGVDLTLAPYLGSAPALTDLLAGNVHVMFDPLPSSIPHIRAGKLVALAVTTPERLQVLHGVPAAAEVVPGYEAGSWFGIVAPKGTPAEIVELLNREANAALADSRINTRLADIGATAMPGSSDQFNTFIARETERYAGVIRAAKIVAK
jgi:tripartite-type tricarboxylate transporter receptor subunit TctC